MEKFLEFFTQPIIQIGLVILAIHFGVNFYKYKRSTILYRYFCSYHLGEMPKFPQYTEEVRKLFLDAGLQDFSFLLIHDHGIYGRFQSTASGYNNMTSPREDVLPIMNRRFNEAIGVYRMRYMGTFNPFYWIEFILRLPEHLMKLLGLMPESKWTIGIIKLLVWLFIAVLVYFKWLDAAQLSNYINLLN